MRLAIITLPLHSNYGGILQAYALQTLLQRMGHEVDVLQKSPSLNWKWWAYPLIYGKRIISKYICRSGRPILRERKLRKAKKVIEQNIIPFIYKNINIRVIDSFNDIKKGEYNAFIVGSDQIWRPKYMKYLWRSDISNAYLQFARGWDIKRIAYAASFGVDEWEYTDAETLACRELLQYFDSVSVRELSGIRLCEEYFNKRPDVMLDPTMLLEKNDYLSLIDINRFQVKAPYLFTYILDQSPEIQEFIETIGKQRNLIVNKGNAEVDNYQLDATQRIQPPVQDWIAGIANAEFIVTDSFHACVFAIIFNKPFIVIGNDKRGMTRFDSLLSTFCLYDHMIHSFSEYEPARKYEIDSIVKDRLEVYRNNSKNYLQSALSDRGR